MNTVITTRDEIQRPLSEQFDDLDFADGNALLSHTQNQMQGKLNTFYGRSQLFSLKLGQRHR